MFDMKNYEYDSKHCRLEIGGENMVYHCHHYLTNLQRTVFDAEYMDGSGMIIGCAADATYYQLSNLCKDLSVEDSKLLAQDMYKTFGNGLIDLSAMDENGLELSTTKSVIVIAWDILFGKSKKPVDCYTTGYLAAAYAVIYKKELKNINAVQTQCMSMGANSNIHIISEGENNFPTYKKKGEYQFNDTPNPPSSWSGSELLTSMFKDVHKGLVGNEEGFIPAFGVYLVNNQSDYVNRIQFEFIKAVESYAGEYGKTLGGELLMEAGTACGFFTLGGLIASPEWNQAVKPHLKTKEDWIHAAVAVTNNMGWGYQVVTEISKDKMVFRNYNDFEDMSYMRMYGNSEDFTHWANSGGWYAVMPIIYHSDFIETGEMDQIELYKEVRKSKFGYKIKRTKGISNGDNYLEVEVAL